MLSPPQLHVKTVQMQVNKGEKLWRVQMEQVKLVYRSGKRLGERIGFVLEGVSWYISWGQSHNCVLHHDHYWIWLKSERTGTSTACCAPATRMRNRSSTRPLMRPKMGLHQNTKKSRSKGLLWYFGSHFSAFHLDLRLATTINNNLLELATSAQWRNKHLIFIGQGLRRQ